MINVETVADCANLLKIGCTASADNILISGISIDTRTLQQGDVYVALCGDRFDGHDFVPQAVKAGASCIISEKQMDAAVPVLCVADTLGALATLARYNRAQFAKPVIAITGSCGKTTVKEICRKIFANAGNVLCPTRSFNNHIGCPLTLCQLTADHDFAILECGTNHPGEIAHLVSMVQPTVALVNNVGPAHLEGLLSIEGVAREKGDIYRGLMPTGTAVINLDDNFADDFVASIIDTQSVITFSCQQDADVTAREIQFQENACAQFILSHGDDSAKVTLALPGEHQVANALAASSCALAAGLSLVDCAAGLAIAEASSGRWQVYQGHHGATVIDDTYNANPKSVEAAIDCLSHYTGDRWFVLGAMGELGDASVDFHRQVGISAAEKGIDCLFTVGTAAKVAAEAFSGHSEHCADQADLINLLKNRLRSDVTVAVKGSRASAMENIVSALTQELK